MMAPQLRIYPAESPPAPQPWTLRRVWVEILCPRKRREGIDPSTEGFYTRALRDWDAFCETTTAGGRDTLLPQQDVSSITDADLQAYQDYLIASGQGHRSINSRLTSIGAILRAAAEKQIIGQAPPTPTMLDEGEPDPIQLEHEELDALFEACEVARWPRRCGPQADGRRPPLPYRASDGWRTALVWYFNYGMRPGELIGQTKKAQPVTWRQISFDRRTPARNGKAECDHGWLWYTPSKQRRKKPRPLFLPLTEITRRYLDSIRPPAGFDPARPLLDWPRGNKQLQRQWQAIVAAAGISLKPDPETGDLRPIFLRDMRSTCSSWLDDHEPGISPYIVGHAADRNPGSNVLTRGGTDVSARHYVRMEKAVVRALTTFPQPASFLRGPSTHGRQLRLF